MNKPMRVWSLQEAKAKFSEVVRRAQAEGPQLVTVHGKDAVMITAVTENSVSKKKLTGGDFLRALRANPGPDFEIPERPKNMIFRDVDL